VIAADLELGLNVGNAQKCNHLIDVLPIGATGGIDGICNGSTAMSSVSR
jgi:hypothetical protein